MGVDCLVEGGGSSASLSLEEEEEGEDGEEAKEDRLGGDIEARLGVGALLEAMEEMM